jgi:hypothetical protein
VSPTADGQVVVRKTDPNQTHPLSATELLKSLNGKRPGRKLTTYDLQAICWRELLRENAKYAWRHSNGATHVWSGGAVTYRASLTDQRYDQIRAEYGTHRKGSPKKAGIVA